MSGFRRMVSGSAGCEDLLAWVYDLNDLETSAYFALLEEPRLRVEQLADALDRDRSTAHRAVQRLLDVGIAERETESLEAGGYYYVYQAEDPERVRERIEDRIAEFERTIRDQLDSFAVEARDRIGERGMVENRPRAVSS